MQLSLSRKMILFSGIILLFATILLPITAKTSDWKLITPDKLTTEDLYVIYGFSSDDMHVAGKNGFMFHYDGSKWWRTLTGTTSHIRGMWGTDASNIYAVGFNGTILHYNGRFWDSVPHSITTEYLYDVWGTAADNIYAVGVRGTVLHYDGTNWTQIDVGSTNLLTGIWGTGPNDIFISVYDGSVLHYDGTAWTSTPVTPGNLLYDVWGTASDNVYVVGKLGNIYRFNGTSWQKETSNTTVMLHSITGTGKNNIYVTGQNGTVVQYNGSEWTSSTLAPNAPNLWDSFALSPEEVFVTGGLGVMSMHDGTTWTNLFFGTFNDFHGVWGDGTGHVYFAPTSNANDVKILHYDGTEWMEEGEEGTFNGIWGYSKDSIYVVGDDHTARHYNGTEWIDIYDGNETTRLLNVWGSSDTDVYAVGYSNFARHYDGTQWTNVDITSTSALGDVWGTAADDVYIVSSSGNIYKYDSSTWAIAHVASPPYPLNGIFGIHGTDNTIFVTATAPFIMLRYENGTWYQDAAPTGGHLEDVWASDSDNAYAVGTSGYIVHYNGEEWYRTNSRTSIYLRGIWGSSANDIYAVGNDGTILHFSGSTSVKADNSKQAAGATVEILDAARNEIDQSTLEANYNTENREPLAETRDFIASISGNTKGLFQFNVRGISGFVSKLHLLKLLPSGTTTDFSPYNPAATTDSPSGTWWIENSSGITVLETAELDKEEVYTVCFIIEDNSVYDINPADGLIHDPILLTKDTTPDDPDTTHSSSGGGCGITRDPNDHAYDLAFLLLMATLLLGLRNRGRHNRTQHYPDSE